MRISLGNAWAQIESADPAQRRWLEEYTGCERRGPFGDPEWAFMVTPTGLLPAGLVVLAERAAPSAGVALQVVDQRGSPPCSIDRAADLAWLRPDQLGAVEDMAAAGRGLLQAPTGSGKTEVFIALTRVFPCEWLLVVHRLDLVEQTAARYLKRTGETAGTFLRGGWSRGTGNATVATFQSVREASRRRRKSYLDFRDAVQAVFVDEVHAQPAGSFYRVTMSLKNAYYRFGCSATPLMRGDLAALRTVGALGPVVHQTTVREMVDLDLLARPRVRMVRMRHKHDECWSWHEVYKRCLVRSAERNGLVADMVERAAKPALVFVDHLEHARALRPELEARGLLVALADGHDWKDARARVLGRLGRGELDAVVCTVIFQEGIDVPELRSVVVGAGKASAVAAVQRVGRGMRKVAGKDEFEVWDVWDRSQKWLRQHSKDRAAAYASLGYEVEVLEEVPGILENEEISPKLASDDEDEDGASGERSDDEARHS